MAIVNGKNVRILYLSGEPFVKGSTDSGITYGALPIKATIKGETKLSDIDPTQSDTDFVDGDQQVGVLGICKEKSTGEPLIMLTGFKTMKVPTGLNADWRVPFKYVKNLIWGGKLAHLYTMVERFIARKAVVAWL